MNKFVKYGIIVLVVVAVVACLFILNHRYTRITDKDLSIYFFNAGKADACIIKKNNKYMMIDTGEEDLSAEILAYFKKNKINKLDYLIITHFDKDHVGSAASIINSVEVDNILQSNYPKESDEYESYLQALEGKDIDVKTITGDFKFALDDLEIVVNGPVGDFDNNESNNSSLITAITYKDNKFLFMGDAQNGRIKEFLNHYNEKADFIKIPYHGNYMKQLDNLLDVVKPKIAVITSSKKEQEDDKTVNLLRNLNIKTYLTRNGAVMIKSNGNYIKVEQ